MDTSGLFIRLYLDENVFPDLAVAVRQRGFDATSAFDATMLGKSDEEQLHHAASEGRCLSPSTQRTSFPSAFPGQLPGGSTPVFS
jgi:hypothetical protein